MDEKQLDELMHDMKRDYKKLPEAVDTRSVMKRIFQEEKKAPRNKVFPILAMIVGMALFMIMATAYVNEFRYEEGSHPGNASDDVAENELKNSDYEAIYEELEQYLLERKEVFQKDLGLNTVDSFKELQNAENIVENLQLSDEPLGLKEGIAFELSTPSMLVEALKNGENSLLEILKKMQTLKDSLSAHLTNLRLKHSIDVYDQEEILEAQDDVAIYQGPAEIAAFLDTLNKQGYRVVEKDFGGKSIGLGIDYGWVYEQTENIDMEEGYKAYIELLATIVDMNNPGVNNAYNTPWTEFDTVLLEIEELYDSYPELRESLFYDFPMGLQYTASGYLNDYLAGGADTSNFDALDPPDEMAKEEFERFIHQHKDSRFVSVVAYALESYEEIDWRGGMFFNVSVELAILFDDRFEEVKFEDIYDFVHNSYGDMGFITNYKKTKDVNDLQNREPLAILQAYMRYFEMRDIETYSTLYTADSRLKQEVRDLPLEEIKVSDETFVWLDLFNSMSVVVEEEITDDLTEYSFISSYIGPVTIEGTIQMKQEDGLWKIFDKQLNEEGFYYQQMLDGKN